MLRRNELKMRMKEMILVAISGILLGCVNLRPWDGFLDSEHKEWRTYLDQRIDVECSNQPIENVLKAPLFPEFNCVILLGEPHPSVNIHAKGITRRETLWRIEKQCDLEMGIVRDENGRPRYVLIGSKKKDAVQPTTP